MNVIMLTFRFSQQTAFFERLCHLNFYGTVVFNGHLIFFVKEVSFSNMKFFFQFRVTVSRQFSIFE